MTPAQEAEKLRLELELLELEEAEALAASQQAQAPVSQSKSSVGQALLKGVQDLPTFGFGDELGGALQAGLLKLSGDSSSFSENYRKARDELRQESKAAAAEHPLAYYGAGLAASLPGAAATAPLKVAKGASVLTRALAGAGNAAIQGGVAGAGNSESGSIVSDTAKGAAGGAVLGGGLSALGALPGALERGAIRQGRRVLLGGADSLSSRVPTSDAAVMEALRSKAIRPFSNTQGALERLEGLSAEQGREYASIISKLEDAGVKGPDARKVAEQLLEKGSALESQTMNNALPSAYLDEAEKLISKAGGDGRLGLKQAENLKRSLQDTAKYGRIEETSLNEVRRDIASIVREANEKAAIEGAQAAGPEAQALAEQFIPTKQRLSRLIEARKAAERGSQRAAQRSAIGLPDYVMAAGGLAGGGPIQAAATGAVSNLFRNRGASTFARGALGASDLLQQEFIADLLRRGANASGRLPAWAVE